MVPLVCSCIAVASLYLAQSIASAFAAAATAPRTRITIGPSGRVHTAEPRFEFSASQSGSTFECSLDGGSFTPCSSPKTLGPLADGAHSFAVRATGPFKVSYLSPRLTDAHQGYATDGTYHYLFGTNSIYKRNDDATWSLVAANRNANSHLLSTHLGDGDYYNGYLYVPSELYRSCRPGFISHQSILVFRASDLSRIAVHDISAEGHEASGVAVAPDIGANGTIFASDYCNPFYIYKYDLHSFAFLGGVHISHKIFLDQGIAYRDGLLYTSSDGRGGRIYVINPVTGAANLVYKSNTVVAHWEGIDYSQSTLRRTLFFKNRTQKIQYLSVGDTDPTPVSRSFTVDLRKGRIFAHLVKNTFTRAQVGKVKLVYRFSPPSERFHYELSRAHGASWLTVRTVTRSGDFKGSHSITIKALFASKPIENGRYRVMLSAEANQRVLTFEIQ